MFERIKEDAGRGLTEFTDSDHSQQAYYWITAVGLAINALSWLTAIVTPEAIAGWIGFVMDLSDRVRAYFLAIPFWSTFFAVYAAMRLRRYKNPTAALADEDVLASYRDTERGNYIRNRILISLAAAAGNVILLVFVVLTLRR